MSHFRWPALLLIACLAFAVGCGKTAAKSEAADAAAAAESEANSVADPLSIEPDEIIRRQLKVGTLADASLSQTIAVAARVEVDGTRVTRVGTPVMGRVTSIMAQEGQHVEAGQTLAQVNSTLLSDGQLSFLKAQSQSQVAQRAVDRAKILLKAEVIGSAELQRREAELSETLAEREAAKDQLLLLGMAPETVAALEKNRKIDSTSRIVASMGGTVLSRSVTLGQVVQPADSVFEIADLSMLWLVADVPAPEAGGVFIGQSVEAIIGIARGSKVSGRLSFVGATVNPETRTVRVRMQLPNSRGWYKPAMLAEMRLKGHAQRRPCVPNTSVVREEEQDHVFIEQDGGASYKLRIVQLGDEFGACRALTSGIDPDERIVLDGAFHMNNERRRRVLRSGGGQ